jgi:integrating conjugative element protein (TIGR03757 family)
MNCPQTVVSWISRCQAIQYLLPVIIYSTTFGTAYAIPTVQVEVFITTGCEVVGQRAIGVNEQIQNVDFQVYELNGIQQVEAELSKDLTANPDNSERLALQRIQALDDQARGCMQRSAVGLARAMQYGVDRFPAIVFDGQAVVYGVIDLQVALVHYESWRTGLKP